MANLRGFRNFERSPETSSSATVDGAGVRRTLALHGVDAHAKGVEKRIATDQDRLVRAVES